MRKNELTETLAGILELIPLAESEYGRSHTIPTTMRQFLSRFGGNAGKNALTSKIREARTGSLERAGGADDTTPRRLQSFSNIRQSQTAANPNRKNVFGRLGETTAEPEEEEVLQTATVITTEGADAKPADTPPVIPPAEDAGKKKEQGQSLAPPPATQLQGEDNSSRQLSTGSTKAKDQGKEVPQNQIQNPAVAENAGTDAADKSEAGTTDGLSQEKAEAFVTKVQTKKKNSKAADSVALSEEDITQVKLMKPTAIANQFGAVRITLTLQAMGVEIADGWSEIQLAAALKNKVK